MTPDFRGEYVLRCSRLGLSLALLVGLLLLAGAAAGGYYLGWQSAVRTGPDPWATLALPVVRSGGQPPSPAGGSPLPGETGGTVDDSDSPAAMVAPPPALREEPVPPPRPAPAGWCVQLATRGSRSQAESEAAALTARGLQARVEVLAGANGPRYLVRLGEFARRAEAEQYAAALANRGLITDFLVVEL